MDRNGTECLREWECPTRVQDMMIIVDDVRRQRSDILRSLGVSNTYTPTACMVPRIARNNYDEFARGHSVVKEQDIEDVDDESE